MDRGKVSLGFQYLIHGILKRFQGMYRKIFVKEMLLNKELWCKGFSRGNPGF